MQEGTAAPPLSIAQPVSDEPRSASRHVIIGRWGLGVSIAASVLFLVLGMAHAGFHRDVPPDLWAWGRATLITLIVIGLVLAGFGYGVHAANVRGGLLGVALGLLKDTILEAVKLAKDAIIKAIADSRVHMHDDHAALHLENLEQRERIRQVEEVLGRVCEQLAAIRKENADMHELLAVMRQESPPAHVVTQRVNEMDARLEETERTLATVAPKVDVAYMVGFTDGVGGTPEE